MMRSLLVAVVIGLLANVSQASLIGDTITVKNTNGLTTNGPLSVLVGPGVELMSFGTSFNNVWNIDIGASTISFSHARGTLSSNIAADDVYEFSNLDWLPTPGEIVGVTVSDISLAQGTVEVVGFTSNSLTVAVRGTWSVNSPDHGFNINIDARHNDPVVPEPASVITWCLLGLTISGGYWWRRKK